MNSPNTPAVPSSSRLPAVALHVAMIALLLVALKLLPVYHSGLLARIMIMAIYAMGYNILFGYTGLLSLGQSLLFAAGLYGAALSMVHLDFGVVSGFVAGILAALVVSSLLGLLVLKTSGVAFMIVTLMFAQAGYLTLLYFNRWTRGDEGFTIDQATRVLLPDSLGIDLTGADARYITAWALFSLCLIIKLLLVTSAHGKVLVAVRENEARTRLLGYDPWRYRLAAYIVSGLFAGISGASYAILFGYAGATFASIQYSILPLLWVLLGGAGIVLGPLLGTTLMTYLIDLVSEWTNAWLLFVGLALLFLVLAAPRGILGRLRDHLPRWLP